VEGEVQPPREHGREATVIQDSQETTTEDRARRGISQGITKYGRMDSTQTREGGSFDRRYPNPFVTSLAPVQRIPTPPSGSSSKDEAATSGSEVNLRPSRAISQSKRKLNLIEDFGEEDRGQSISTAVTTPLSALQQPNHQSPMFDNKKLRRPTLRAGKSNTEEQEVAKALPRQNVYEVIETDTERPSAKSATQNVLSKIGNSYKWKQRSSTTPNSEKSSPRQRRTTVTKEKDLQSAEDERLNHEDQQQKLEQERNRAATLAKQRAEKERSKLAFEAAERRRLEKEAEEKKKQDEAKLKNERVAAETRRQEALKAKEVAAQARAEAEAEATRKRNALAKAEADKTAQLMEKARLEEDEKARLEEQRKAMLEEERRAREASEADKLRLGIDALRKAEKENDLKEQALLQLRQENRQKSQNLKASLEATVRRAASTPAKAVTARDGHSATEATLEAGDIVPASTAGPAIISNKRVTCTPFIPRGRPSGLSPAALHSSEATTESLPRVSSPNVGLEDQMPMPPQLKRKVSFVDQVPPSRGRSSSVSSALRQTTLVPPSAVKSTLKRTPMKANSNGSKPSKGALFSFWPDILLEYIVVFSHHAHDLDIQTRKLKLISSQVKPKLWSHLESHHHRP
jgi:hypothetical protein